MKLKYKIAKPTELTSEAVIKKILLIIEREKYGIVDVTSTSVTFDDKRRLIRGNWEFASRLNSGKFEIVKNGESNVVIFEYLPIPVFEFIWVGIICAVPLGFSIVNKVGFAGFLCLPFLGQLLFKHYNLKRIASEMLDEVST